MLILLSGSSLNVSPEMHFIWVQAEEIIHHGSPSSLLIGEGNHSCASLQSALLFGEQGRSHTVALMMFRFLLPPMDLLGTPSLWFQQWAGVLLGKLIARIKQQCSLAVKISMEIVNPSTNSKGNTKCYVFLQHGIWKVRSRRQKIIYQCILGWGKSTLLSWSKQNYNNL